MNADHIKQQIESLLGITMIPQEEKAEIRQHIASMAETTLEKLRDNLMHQAASDIYMNFLDEVDMDDRLMTEEDTNALQAKINEKIGALENTIFTQTEIAQLRQQIADIHAQSTALPPPAPVE